MRAAGEDTWDKFAQGISELKDFLSHSRARIVRNPRTQAAARTLAQHFYREVRPHLDQLGIPKDAVALFDEPIGKLLQVSNLYAEHAIYDACIIRIRQLYNDITPLRETRIAIGVAVLTPVERRIIETLEKLEPSAANSYQQALVDLSGTPRHSYRGVAHELRETLREALNHFAPDADVMAEPGFQLEKGLSRPTQRQKALYILRKRRLSREALQVSELAVSAIEEISALITRSAYTRGAMSAHGRSSATEIRQMKMYVDAVLAELLEIHGQRQ